MVAELFDSAIGDVTIDNSAAETTLFSSLLEAGWPGPDKFLIARSISDIRNDSGAAHLITEQWKFGPVPTILHSFQTISIADAGPTNRYADIGLLFLGGANSASAQRSMYEHKQGGQSPLGGSSGGNDHNVTVNSSAVDSSVAQTLLYTVQLPAANTELEFRQRGMWLERWDTADPADGIVGTRLVAPPNATEVTWTNSAAENSIYSEVIPGGWLSTGNLLVCRLDVDVLFTTSTTQYFFEVYFGGTKIIDSSAGVSNVAGATRRAAPIEVWIGGHGATNDQVCAMIGRPAASNLLSGEGLITTPSGFQALQHVGACAIDSTIDQTLEITATMNSALSGSEVRKVVGQCSVIKA
jgi:hypothetical protein